MGPGWQNTRNAFDVAISDRTDELAVLGVMGPNARTLLSRHTKSDLSDAAFPFATSTEIDVAGVRLRASRITYVGTLGWELYMDWQDAARVFDALSGDGQSPVALAGYHAMDSLRLEKAYRHWGHDITDEDTPLEAGLSFTCAWEKSGGFIGREALLAQKARGLNKRLALFSLADPAALLYHDEPIWADGERVGRITSGAFGHSLGRALGFGYVTLPEPFLLKSLQQKSFAIEVGEEMIPARVSTRALYDSEQNEIR